MFLGHVDVYTPAVICKSVLQQVHRLQDLRFLDPSRHLVIQTRLDL